MVYVNSLIFILNLVSFWGHEAINNHIVKFTTFFASIICLLVLGARVWLGIKAGGACGGIKGGGGWGGGGIKGGGVWGGRVWAGGVSGGGVSGGCVFLGGCFGGEPVRKRWNKNYYVWQSTYTYY